MKRVLHITGTMDRAGAETMIMNSYRVIDKTQIQFDFLYFTSKKCDFDEEIESLGGKIYRIIQGNPISRMFATKKLLKENSQWKTVHAHNLFSNAFHMYAAHKADVKQRISHAHSNDTQNSNKILKSIYQYISRKVQSKYATEFLACTPAAGKFLFPNKRNVQVLKNSIDSEYFVKIGEEHKDYLRKQFNINGGTLVLLQIGRLNSIKNHQFSLKIANELKNKNIKFKLFFAGEGALLRHLKKQVKGLNLENEIVFLGLRTDVANLLAGSDLMLMPSLYEGFGVVLIEAQAIGIPSLISHTIPSDADIGIDLIYVKSLKDSVEVWANCIIEILKKNVAIEKGKRLLKLREFGYDHHISAQVLFELYKTMK
jgi:glycosyltransferase EpsF